MCINLQFQEEGKEGEIHSKSGKGWDAYPSELLLWEGGILNPPIQIHSRKKAEALSLGYNKYINT